MAVSDLLNRRVRARPEDDEEAYSEAGSGSASASEDARDDEISDQDSEKQDGDDGSEGSNGADVTDNPDAEDDDDNPDDFQASLNNISFGALAKAQSSLGPKKQKRTTNPTDDDNEETSPLDDIRARIREAREQKRQASSTSTSTPASTSASTSEKSRDMEKRTSKHAPMVQSTKHAVSRKRTVIEPPAITKSRDPRFDPTVVGKNSRMPSTSSDKAYSFLNDYRATELKDLKEQLAKTKDPNQKEELKLAVRSTTDRLRESENRKREQKILAEHKQREKQMIRDGKKSNPYYMKKSDLKKEVVLAKYNEMNSKDRSKALERRRKKMASKERLQMPFARRGAEGPPPSSEGRKRKRLT